MDEYVDLPKQDILDLIIPEIKKQVESAAAAVGKPTHIERVEWTKDGLRLWIRKQH